MARITIATWGEKYRLRVMNKENLLAYFDFVDQDNGLEYQDWQLMKGKNGLFVSAPGKKPYENKDKKTIYPKYVAPAYDGAAETKRSPSGEKFFADVLAAAKTVYDLLNTDEQPAARAKKSGAGPLPSTVPDDLGPDESDDLPF